MGFRKVAHLLDLPHRWLDFKQLLLRTLRSLHGSEGIFKCVVLVIKFLN